MPQLDSCHPQVVRALEKAGWNVAPKLFVIILDNQNIFQRMAMPVIKENGIKMLVVDMAREVIETWIE